MTEIKGRPFDPAQGTTVVEPAGAGKGHWVGALGVLHDPATGDTYMFYRSRRPIGEGRGRKCQGSGWLVSALRKLPGQRGSSLEDRTNRGRFAGGV